MLRENIQKWSRIFIAETIGTSFLLIINCFGCVNNYHNFNPSHITISIGAGLALMIGINSFATISGAHINPVVTAAALVFKMINKLDAIIYVVAQLFGAIFGYIIVRILIPPENISNPDSFCMNLPQMDNGKAVVVEFIITFIMMCVVCAVWDPRNAQFQDSASLRIGLTVSILVFIAGNLSGGSMNPARSFGPAFYNSHWNKHWIYWVGPTMGSLTAAILFKNVLIEEIPDGSRQNIGIGDEEQLEQIK